MSKYGNKRTEYNGRTYHSKREAEFARQLDLMRFAKDPKEKVVRVKPQPRFPIVVNGKKICTYVSDFEVEYADGRVEVVDVKGYKTNLYKLKKKLVEATYNITIIEY